MPTSFHLPTLSTHLLLFSLLLLLSFPSSTNASLSPVPRRHAHAGRSSSSTGVKRPTPGTSVKLEHNQAYHQSKKRDGLDWLLREKTKLEHKYGGEEADGLGRRADMPVTLANQDKDASYSATISIGSPAQSFNVALDTGSADLWLLSTECSLSACSPLDKFDPTTSTSYKNGTTAFSIAYGSGDARGHLGADTVTLGGFSVQSQTFGVVNSMSDGLLDSPLSGLMGMGFKSLTVTGTTPWWISLASSTAWSEPLFGFYMKRYRDVADAQSTETEGGTLTLGYVDETLYEGDITYVSVDSDKQRYWNIPIASMTVQGKTVALTGVQAAIDTGTTLIGGPEADVRAFYANIPNSRAMTGSYAGYWEYPCATAIDMTMTFGSFEVTINERDFNIGGYSDDASYCTGGVFVQGLSSSSPVQWVVGDTMLKNVYSIYRMTPAAVGFAALPGSGAVSSSSSAASSGASSSSSSTSTRSSSASSATPAVSTSVVVVTATGSVDLTASGTLQSTLMNADSTAPLLQSTAATTTAGAVSQSTSATGAAQRDAIYCTGGMVAAAILTLYNLI